MYIKIKNVYGGTMGGFKVLIDTLSDEEST